ncbi:MAG: hypothetical protein IPK82_07905 [Polyangiaceae bacterium]|nr:hypothetical protein [Polyangiaceae bacterium]
MARTAPVPNFPAIPGMNPGIFVMGGGGDGGGSGPGGGKGKGANQNGKGKNGGNDAEGDGKGANGCGAGSGGSCTNCSANPAKGDPVAIGTGDVFTIPRTDVLSPGFVDLLFTRQYTSRLRDVDQGLGFGWTHSFAWTVDEGRRLYFRKGCGTEWIPFDTPTEDQPTSYGDWVLTTRNNILYLDTGDDFTHVFQRHESGAWLLTYVAHITLGGFALSYDAATRLVMIKDSAGRKISVRRDSRHGRIVSLFTTDPANGVTITHATYTYDERGDLVCFVDADGFATYFEYDEDHRLTRQRLPDGPTFHYVYDAQGRCVESWGDYGDKPDPALAPDLSPTLEDGKTPAKGFTHIKLVYADDGYVEYSDSVRFQRFFFSGGGAAKADAGGLITTRAFDANGAVISHTDQRGETTTYKRDPMGQLLQETDPLGRTLIVERDHLGRVLRNVDYAGNAVSYVRDLKGRETRVTNQRGATMEYEYDARGRITKQTDPMGAVTQYIGDAMGNLVEVIQPSGARWRFEYDYFGRMIRRIDPYDRQQKFSLSAGGSTLRAEQGDWSVEYSYDGMGCVTRVSAPEGTYQIEYGGFRWPYRRTEPNGDVRRVEYNREGWPVRQYNEAGDKCSFEYDAHGIESRVVYFDNTEYREEHDAMHMVKKTAEGADEVLFTRDALGRPVQFEYPDDRTIALEYDVFGNIAVASAPEGVHRFDYDPVGNVVAETQEIDGVKHWVKAEWNESDRLIGLTTSLGHTVKIERNLAGERTATILDGTRIAYERDRIGLETTMALPGGACIVSEYDERYRLARRKLHKPANASVGPGHPDWIGPAPGDILADTRYAFAPTSQLVERADSARGTVRYTYDNRRRLISAETMGKPAELFSRSPEGNLKEHGKGAEEREYGPGNRLLRRGKTHYTYDERARLIEKRVEGENGNEAITKYKWNAARQLVEVQTPDELTVFMTYDPFHRRTKKTVISTAGGGKRFIKETRFIWFGSSLIHEITRHADGKVDTRTYAHTDRRFQPFAHRDARDQSAPEEWVFYVGDIMHTPERLVRGDGQVIGELTRAAFGKTHAAEGSKVTTQFRFIGQYEDEETGLHYNFHRYYDPDIGQYISPDPLRLREGENFYAYCHGDPITTVDPYGLGPHGCECEIDIGSGEDKTTWVPHSENSHSPQNPETGQFISKHKKDGELVDIPGAKPKGGGDSINTGGALGKTSNTGQTYGHTEQHACEWAEKNFPGKLKGSHMKLGGGLPPCPRCNERMAQFSKDNKSTVDYKWPEDNHVQYKNGKGPNVMSSSHKTTGELATAYQERNSYALAGEDIPSGKSGETEYQAAKKAGK